MLFAKFRCAFFLIFFFDYPFTAVEWCGKINTPLYVCKTPTDEYDSRILVIGKKKKPLFLSYKFAFITRSLHVIICTYAFVICEIV